MKGALRGLLLTLSWSALFSLLGSLLWSGPAYAATIRFIAESDSPFERRLVAEIESVGFEVERPANPESTLPTTTAAIVYVRSDPPQVELWLLGETGRFQLSSVVRDDASEPDDDADTTTLRIAERLRALLQPVYVQVRAAEVAAESQPPKSFEPREPEPRAAQPASHATRPIPRARVLEPEDDLRDQTFSAAIGVGFAQHASDVVPEATLAFDYAPLRRLGLGALAIFPLRKAMIEAGGDRAELETWMGGLHGYARVAPLEPVELQLGAGLLAAYVRAQGDAVSPRFGRSVSGLRWVPFLEGAAVYAPTPSWQLRGAGLIGLGLPSTPIEFAGDTVAEWGKPWISTQLSLGYTW